MKIEYIFETLFRLESVAFAIMSAGSGLESQPVNNTNKRTNVMLLTKTFDIDLLKKNFARSRWLLKFLSEFHRVLGGRTLVEI
jgi:hypothetical protein